MSGDATGPLRERLSTEPPVRAVREALEGAAAWIVGGTIRDALLGRPVADVDIAVSGDVERAARAVARKLGGPAFSLSDDFGSWRVLDRGRRLTCDVSPLQGDTIERDLELRDFTVNAMGMALAGGELIDPHGGRRDLHDGVLRVLGAGAYERDGLRALRLVRLAAELGLRPDSETERLTRAAAPGIARAAAERIFGELRRTLTAPGVVEGLELAERLGVLAVVLPEVSELKGVEQSRYHHLDVYEHTLEVVRQQILLEGDLEGAFGDLGARVGDLLAQPFADELTGAGALRLGALLHDIGKPATRGVREDGRVTFLGHDRVGAEMVGSLCERLRTSGKLREHLMGLTRAHLATGFLVHQRPLTRSTVYRYLRFCEPVEVEVTVLSCADRRATRGRGADEAIAAHLEVARELLGAALAWRSDGPPSPLVRGDELARELDIAPGPELGRVLEALREAQYGGEVTSREEAVRHARAILAAGG